MRFESRAALLDGALHKGEKEAASLYALSLYKAAPEAESTKYAIGRVKAAQGAYGEARGYFDAACKLGNKEACYRASLLNEEGF